MEDFWARIICVVIMALIIVWFYFEDRNMTPEERKARDDDPIF